MTQLAILGAVASAAGPLVRTAFNQGDEALCTDSEGPLAPPTAWPFMRWRNDAAQRLYRRDAGNAAWEIIAEDGAAVDPGPNDDAAAGYVRGATWINAARGRVFICADATAGAAVWWSVGGIADLAAAWVALLAADPPSTIQGLLAAADAPAARATIEAAAAVHTHDSGELACGTLDGDRLPPISSSARGGVPAFVENQDEGRVLTPLGWAPLLFDPPRLADLAGLASEWAALLAADPAPVVRSLLGEADPAAIRDSIAAAAASHAHDVGELVSGTLDGDRLPSLGTAGRGGVPPYVAGQDEDRGLTPAGWRTIGTRTLADISDLAPFWR